MKYLIFISLLILSFSCSACEKIKAAHNKLLKSSFSVNKNVEISLDNEDKMKFKSHARYIDGSLSYSKKNILFSSDDFRYKEDYQESFLVTGFTCEDITVDGELVVIIVTQEDIKHTSYFLYRAGRLTPMKSTMEAKVGMFFFSWYAKNIEEYSNFKIL